MTHEQMRAILAVWNSRSRQQRPNEQLVAAVRKAREALAEAYGYAYARPLETVPPAWAAARDAEAQRRGVRLWKYFR